MLYRILPILLCTALPAASSAQARDSVWVNTRSRVYHCPGTQYYGRTVRGEFLGEPEAQRRGFRPAGGRVCFAATARQTATPELGAQGRGTEPSAPARETQPCVVSRISDGDTIECTGIGRIRLIGTDSPEQDQEPYGTAATAALAAMLPLGAEVELEPDDEARDRYDRILAYVWYDGSMVNWLLVRYGWGVSYRYPPNVRYAATLDSAEASARSEGRGLWRVGGFRCRPADRRARRC